MYCGTLFYREFCMSLAKKFDADLTNKIAELRHCGYVEFNKWELLTWFQRDRITSVIWDEIYERWSDVWEGSDSKVEDNPLMYRDTGKSYIIINKSYFEDLYQN